MPDGLGPVSNEYAAYSPITYIAVIDLAMASSFFGEMRAKHTTAFIRSSIH